MHPKAHLQVGNEAAGRTAQEGPAPFPVRILWEIPMAVTESSRGRSSSKSKSSKSGKSKKHKKKKLRRSSTSPYRPYASRPHSCIAPTEPELEPGHTSEFPKFPGPEATPAQLREFYAAMHSIFGPSIPSGAPLGPKEPRGVRAGVPSAGTPSINQSIDL